MPGQRLMARKGARVIDRRDSRRWLLRLLSDTAAIELMAGHEREAEALMQALKGQPGWYGPPQTQLPG